MNGGVDHADMGGHRIEGRHINGAVLIRSQIETQDILDEPQVFSRSVREGLPAASEHRGFQNPLLADDDGKVLAARRADGFFGRQGPAQDGHAGIEQVLPFGDSPERMPRSLENRDRTIVAQFGTSKTQ